ncbi:MAG: thiamine phosphate synthase [Alphaproteobacteria bacterium]
MRASVDLSLYLILGPTHGGGDMTSLARQVAAGGVTLIQYRDKTSDTGTMVEHVRAIRDALSGTGVPLLVNDRVDVAMAAGADGVHLGQQDMTPSDARMILGPSKIVGLTVKKPDHARAADPRFIDYASVGGVFETTSKRNPDPPIGIDGLREMNNILSAAAPGLPRCAIAGISQDRIPDVIAAGADGICVIRAITDAAHPEEAARLLRATVGAARDKQERRLA